MLKNETRLLSYNRYENSLTQNELKTLNIRPETIKFLGKTVAVILMTWV